MIAVDKGSPQTDGAPRRFLKLLPIIERQASRAFPKKDLEAHEEFVQAVIANAFVAYIRLVERGREHLAFASPLARYAIRQVKAGRAVGVRQNIHDINSRAAQLSSRVVVERLDQFDREIREWREVLVEDPHAGPDQVAAARIDVAAWYRGLARSKRRVARKLARGESTGQVAQMLGVSPSRVSQLRRELAESWASFQGEEASVA